MRLVVERITNTGTQQIIDKLKANGGYYPCSLVQNEDTKCLCKEFREQDTPGECNCGLYRKKVQRGY